MIANAAAKDQKRLEKKAAFLKQMQETAKVREVIIIQDLLRQLKNEAIRKDFLNAQNGACLVEAIEMDVLEKFSKLTIPVHPGFSNEPSFVNSAKTAADFLSFVVDGRNRPFLDTGFTFEKIKELFHRIQTCGYFEKDIKVVEVEEEQTQPPESSQTPQSNVDDLDQKDDQTIGMETDESGPASIKPTAPLPTQVPSPNQLFNGANANVVPGMMPVMHGPIPVIPQQLPTMKTTVTAVENAFYNQMKYSQTQGPMNNNNTNNTVSGNEPPVLQTQQQQKQQSTYIDDFASANISFLQDSLVEQITTGSQSPQLNMPPNMLNQPNKSIQQVHPQNSQPQQQQQQQVTHNFPPGLKLQQGNASNIPVSYQQQLTQHQTQQVPVTSIAQELPLQQHQHYQNKMNPVQQYQQMPSNIQNLQDVEQKTLNAHQSLDAASDKPTSDTSDRNKSHTGEKENHRNNEWTPVNNQQPQIDTWQSEGSASTQGTGYNRFNNRRGGGGPKYNSYR